MMIQISHNTCPYHRHPSTEPVIKSYFYKIVVIFLSLWFLLESSWNCDNFHTAGPTPHLQITWWSSSALIRHGEGSGFEENILPEIIKILHIPWESMYYVLSNPWSGVFLTCTFHLGENTLSDSLNRVPTNFLRTSVTEIFHQELC